LISVFGSDFGDLEISKVQKCLNSQWIGFGELVKEFENEFSSQLGFSDMVMVDSGSNALYLAVKLLDLPPNSNIAVPALTWISCANAIKLAGHNPIFVDVELDTMNVSAETIDCVSEHNLSAIMVVHFAGLPVDVVPITQFDVPIIEDCAHAVYSRTTEGPCGSTGDVSIFSFDAVKNLAVGEGGGLVARDEKLLEMARALRYCGIRKSGFENAESTTSQGRLWWQYELVEPFIKMLPTNLSAAIGLAQLERRDLLQSRRRKIWNFYQENLSGVKGIITPVDAASDQQHSFFTYVIRSSRRNDLARFLLANDVYTTLRYEPLSRYPHFKTFETNLTNTFILEREALSIPLHPRLTDGEVERIVHLVRSFSLS